MVSNDSKVFIKTDIFQSLILSLALLLACA